MLRFYVAELCEISKEIVAPVDHTIFSRPTLLLAVELDDRFPWIAHELGVAVDHDPNRREFRKGEKLRDRIVSLRHTAAGDGHLAVCCERNRALIHYCYFSCHLCPSALSRPLGQFPSVARG